MAVLELFAKCSTVNSTGNGLSPLFNLLNWFSAFYLHIFSCFV